jgi:SOS-response transcriptional repressor LexA
MSKHFGDWLKRRIESTLLTQKQWAGKHSISFETLRVWLGDAQPRITGRNLERLATALAIGRDELEIMLGNHREIAIPVFDRNLAAGKWTHAIGVEESEVSREQYELGLFRVRIAGDSMKPDYEDGAIVEFRVLRIADDGLEVGGDFYIQRDDDMATFKRVVGIRDEVVTLSAVNKRKHPEPMTVEYARIVRAARAVGIYSPRGEK